MVESPAVIALSPQLNSTTGELPLVKMRDDVAVLRRTLVLFANDSTCCATETFGLISLKARSQIRSSETAPLKQRLSSAKPNPTRKVSGLATMGAVAGLVSSNRPLR